MFSALIATDICKDGVLSTFILRGGLRAETFLLTSGLGNLIGPSSAAGNPPLPSQTVEPSSSGRCECAGA